MKAENPGNKWGAWGHMQTRDTKNGGLYTKRQNILGTVQNKKRRKT